MKSLEQEVPGSTPGSGSAMVPEALKIKECSVTISHPSTSSSTSPTMILSINSPKKYGFDESNGRVDITVLSGDDGTNAAGIVGSGETVAAANGDSGGDGGGPFEPYDGGGGRPNADHFRQLLARFLDNNARLRTRKKPKYAIRPLVDPDGPRSPGASSSQSSQMSREAMTKVFSHLSKRDLVTCMQVCRDWNRWTMDPRLWRKIDVRHTRRFSAHMLEGIVRRQTLDLDLGWSSVTDVQIRWLCERLPNLQGLGLAGLSWSAVSALRHYCCPPQLKKLDLRFVNGLGDTEINRLLSSPIDGRPGLVAGESRLKNLTTLCISGSRIIDSTLVLIASRLSDLDTLDISHCSLITDEGLKKFVQTNSVASKLISLNVDSCVRLSDEFLAFLLPCVSLSYLNCSYLPLVTTGGLENFVSKTGKNFKSDGKIVFL